MRQTGEQDVYNHNQEQHGEFVDFDGDKILSEYDSMTRDDAIDLLGEKYSSALRDRINQGNIGYDEFTQMCKDAFPSSPQRAQWVQSTIFNKLSKTEGFNMFEQDPVKQQTYAKIENFREKANNGELTETDLKDLCEMTFGKDSKESELVYHEMLAKDVIKTKGQENYNANIKNAKTQEEAEINIEELTVENGEEIDLDELTTDKNEEEINLDELSAQQEQDEINLDELTNESVGSSNNRNREQDGNMAQSNSEPIIENGGMDQSMDFCMEGPTLC